MRFRADRATVEDIKPGDKSRLRIRCKGFHTVWYDKPLPDFVRVGSTINIVGEVCSRQSGIFLWVRTFEKGG